ncbi:piggyBac transposable element-derived protein 4-like [Photinus pyralis]|uniref:piggyBac transposable element-derived protein 4-like n=2 Tax=Photinus pyralis TaxID=7054 RepID=UPI0012672D01|nr:piggyBac transposable element-derived protein 4-like [Photinus pyralis]XP_031337343.1 piggyBac transposable element-derived protein 4-like [Photinus pyralis]
MSEKPKFRNENKLTDDELLRILETEEFDYYFENDLALEGAASDIEETDVVDENDEVDDLLLIGDNEVDLVSESVSEGGENLRYIAKDGSEWAKIPYVTRVKRAKHNIQKLPSGLTQYSSKFTSIKEAFDLFFSEDVINIILRETNRKAEFVYSKKNKAFVPIVKEEMDAFLGLLINFGAVHGNKEPVYVLWSQDPVLCRPIVSASLSRNRFQQIMSFLRFDNFETREERKTVDKLAPIRDIFDIFVSNCKKSFNPNGHLCVDEQLVPFRGKAPFRVYMKSKPDKYGIKIWALADCETAYTVNMQVYLGKIGNKPEKGQGQRVVLDMVSHLGQGYGITTDNFFTSIELADKLLQRNLTLCGTLRRNKPYIPSELLPARYKKDFSSMFAFMKDKTLVSYVPKRNSAVVLLSTEHRDDKISGADNDYKPDIILHYNKTKGAVDTTDKLAKEYTTQRKTNRWPMAIFFHLLDIAAINAYKLWIHANPEWKKGRLDKRRMFLLELGHQLVRNNIICRYNKDRSLHEKIKQNMVTVLPELKTDKENREQVPNQKKSGRCHICPRNADKKSRKHCVQCSKFVCAEHSNITTICNSCNK